MLSTCPFRRKKAKTIKTQRAVSRKESIFAENPKKMLVVLSDKVHDLTKKVGNTLVSLQSGEAVRLGKRLTLHPFEDSTALQQLCYKSDCSLFTVFHHSKKRPENITLGRLFNFNVLDMVEFGHGIIQEDINARLGSFLGSKPVVIFTSQSNSPVIQRLQNLFLDIFGGERMKKISSLGLDRVLMIDIHVREDIQSLQKPIEHLEELTFPENAVQVAFYHFAISNTDALSEKPIEVPVGTRIALQLGLRRACLASAKAFNECMHKPVSSTTKEKGVSRDALGNLKGQVHVGKQRTEKIVHRRFHSKNSFKRDSDGQFKKVDFPDSQSSNKKKGYKIPDFASDI